MKINFDGPSIKKMLGFASAIAVGCTAVINALSDQKKNAEFEEMKKTLSELKNK